MDNIKQTVNGNKLTIEIDLEQTFGPSESQKTLIVASTRGGVKLEGRPDVTLSVNCYKPNPNAPKGRGK